MCGTAVQERSSSCPWLLQSIIQFPLMSFHKFSCRTKDVLVIQTTAKSIFKVRQTSLCSCYVFCLHKYVNYQKLCQRSREVVRYVAAHTQIHMPYKGFYPFQFLQRGVLDLKVCMFHGTDAEWGQ